MQEGVKAYGCVPISYMCHFVRSALFLYVEKESRNLAGK